MEIWIGLFPYSHLQDSFPPSSSSSPKTSSLSTCVVRHHANQPTNQAALISLTTKEIPLRRRRDKDWREEGRGKTMISSGRGNWGGISFLSLSVSLASLLLSILALFSIRPLDHWERERERGKEKISEVFPPPLHCPDQGESFSLSLFFVVSPAAEAGSKRRKKTLSDGAKILSFLHNFSFLPTPQGVCVQQSSTQGV